MNAQVQKRPVGRPRADGQAHVSREDVFGAATMLIARNGYAGTSLRTIAGELGVQAPSILYLFKTKDRLLIELVKFLSQYCIDFYERIKSLDMDPDVALFKMVHEATRTLAIEDPELTSIFYLPELRQPAFKEANNQRKRLISYYREQLNKGIKAGKFRKQNAALSAEQIFQLTETNMIALDPAALGHPEQQAKETAKFALRGLLLDQSRLTVIARKASVCKLKISPR